MRIERAEIYHLRMPLKAPFETSFGAEVDRDCILVCLTSEGEQGWGECVASSFPGFSYETIGTAWHILSDIFIPAVLGKNLTQVDHLLSLLDRYKGHPQARAGLEMAFWDLLGRSRGESLASMLGGVKPRVPVGVSLGIEPDEPALLHRVESYLKSGYRRIKLKIKPGKDKGYVEAVRSAFPDIVLQVDANSAYDLEDRHIFEALDSFNLRLIEQPLAEDDLIDHRELQTHLQTPLCLDESIRTLRHARQALDILACRIINIKAARVGGLSQAVRIHDHCQARRVPVWCGGMLETNIGRASNLALASLSNFLLPGDISASERYYERDIAEPDFTLNADSTIDVPQGPGLGVEVDDDGISLYTLRRDVFRT